MVRVTRRETGRGSEEGKEGKVTVGGVLTLDRDEGGRVAAERPLNLNGSFKDLRSLSRPTRPNSLGP